MLLETGRSGYQATPNTEPEFFDALGLQGADSPLGFDARHRRVQVAVDALSLRHQAAEALTRFIYARVPAAPRAGDAKSTWLAIADSPTSMINVIEPTRQRSMRIRSDSWPYSSRVAPTLSSACMMLRRQRLPGQTTRFGC